MGSSSRCFATTFALITPVIAVLGATPETSGADRASSVQETGAVQSTPGVISRSRDILASYAGTYTRPNGAAFEVRVVDSTLVVEANAWLEHALLLSPDGTDVGVLLSRNIRADELADEWMRGGYALLFEAYGGRWSIEAVQERSESQRRSNEMRLGSPRGYRVLGTSVARTGTMTLVRFDYEQGTEYGRYLWREDGGLSEFRTRGEPPRFYPVGGRCFEWRDEDALPKRICCGESKVPA